MSCRLRVIAGPNGSGKSSIFELIKQTKDVVTGKMLSLGHFINADHIEKDFLQQKFIRLSDYGIDSVDETIIDDYINISTLKAPYTPAIIKEMIYMEDGCFKIVSQKSSPYLAMVVADLLREKLLSLKKSFTMETVFSHEDKLTFIERAIKEGYKVYLYFISTESPEINLKRIEGRVKAGGHDVPAEKVVQRYERTMQNLLPALRLSYRAYLFDNSGIETIKVAEKYTDGSIFLEEKIPSWVLKYLPA